MPTATEDVQPQAITPPQSHFTIDITSFVVKKNTVYV